MSEFDLRFWFYFWSLSEWKECNGRRTVLEVGCEESTERGHDGAPVGIFQVVAHAVEFAVALDLALGSLVSDWAVGVNVRVSGVDHWQSYVDGIWRQIESVFSFGEMLV